MKNFSPFALLIAALFFSCGDEVIQTIYVPDTDTVFIEKQDTLFLTDTDTIYLTDYDTLFLTDTDTVYITQYDTVIVYANCDQPFAIGDTFDLESGPYYFEEDSSYIALLTPFDLIASGFTWDFTLFHRVYGDPEESFTSIEYIRVVCGYVPTEEELAYLWVNTNGFVYLWAVQKDDNTFEAEIIYASEFFDPFKQFFTKYEMRRR